MKVDLSGPVRKIGPRRIVIYLLVIFIMLFIIDISRLPDKQVTAKILLFGIRQYQKFLSPNLRGFVRCKFTPTCSHYGYTSIEWYGAFWGSLKAMERLFRCSPWSNSSGYDPP